MANPPHDHGPEMTAQSADRLYDCFRHGIGPASVSNECRKCKSEKQVERGRVRRLRGIEFLGGACMKCGYDLCVAALDFHHRDPTTKNKRWNTNALVNRTWERFKAELVKCDLLCANCHREHHFLYVPETHHSLNKQRCIDYLGGACGDCGYDCPVSLEFHHRDPTAKKFGISLLLCRHASWERLVVELDKCDLKCANCHREHHSQLPRRAPNEIPSQVC